MRSFSSPLCIQSQTVFGVFRLDKIRCCNVIDMKMHTKLFVDYAYKPIQPIQSYHLKQCAWIACTMWSVHRTRTQRLIQMASFLEAETLNISQFRFSDCIHNCALQHQNCTTTWNGLWIGLHCVHCMHKTHLYITANNKQKLK